MKNDQRSYGRIPSLKHISGTLYSEPKPDELIIIQIKDLSPGGVLCESKTAVPVGIIVHLEIKFPATVNDEPCRVTGKIVRCNKNDRSNRFEVAVAYIRKK
ncbi:MAG: PilZ domain-containing protein [Elusimicrobia bacterium]|nr:PilZ domain-containing protein [Elusimicrobiota bacterium]